VYPTANDGAVAHAIEVGDLVYVNGGVAYPAGHLADAGTAAQNRASFALQFAGVAVEKVGLQTGETSFKLTTDKGYIVVATGGVFEYPCAATSWAPDDLVGVYVADTNAAPTDQQVAKVTEYGETIGTAVVPVNALGDSQTAILVELRPMSSHHQVVYGSGQ
jgi:hypothetical protein